MTIDDLKGLMDAFDPASLLPDLGSVTGLIETMMGYIILVGPLAMLVMGLLYLTLSPKEANYYLGYRCFYGMGSVGAWRFSQRLAGVVFGALGLVLTVIMFLISGGYGDRDLVEITWSALKCLLWQAGLAAAACLGINATVAVFYTAKGDHRKKK